MIKMEKQEEVKTSVKDAENGIQKVAKWKAAGLDGISGFWCERFKEKVRSRKCFAEF